jgi:hypothetical protein
MTNAKGPRFERLIRDYLNEAHLHAERTGPELLDESDIHFGMVVDKGEWQIEAKDHQSIDLPGYVRQLEASIVRKGAIPFKGAAVVKKRGQGVAEAYAVMRLERYRQLAAYVMVLEVLVNDLTGAALPIPEELRDYLGKLASTPGNEHLMSVFGEFIGPEEVEVTADGTEVPAGADGEVCSCGEVHTAEERAEAEAFLAFLLSGGDAFEDAPDQAAEELADWERELLNGSE